MRRRFVLAIVMMGVLLAACGGSDDPTVRHVLVDRTLDEFPTSFFGYFPRVIEAHPGDVIQFEQAWTGEPHTVTLGTMVQPLGDTLRGALREAKALPAYVDASERGLPSIFPQTETGSDITLNQIASQACYVRRGPLPLDVKDCDQTQPAFDGTQAFYNSGYIPFEGRKSNEFRVPLAEGTKPGEYFYYCVLHGATMGGFIDVKANDDDVASPRALRDRDIKGATKVAERAYAMSKSASFRLPGTQVQAGTFSLYADGGDRYPVSVNEFVPSTVRTKVGEPVTWSFLNGPGHTVSFDVPSYLPAIVFDKDGTVDVNLKTLNPVGGPGYPSDAAGESPDEGFLVDAGTYDGSHFLSSGYNDGAMRYRVAFTKPGTYPYVCLLHPLMLGRVVVDD